MQGVKDLMGSVCAPRNVACVHNKWPYLFDIQRTVFMIHKFSYDLSAFNNNNDDDDTGKTYLNNRSFLQAASLRR